mmetsp:Transcript_42893/g.113563  ORF Transcript_42893/g.113563 Transcript_42893/m.113563 type:complete len:149 (-) Transcript_42893:423-869(-)
MALLQNQNQNMMAYPLANIRAPRAPVRQANRQAAAVAMWRCCACAKEWKALAHSEKEQCCAFAPCVLSFRPAEAAEVAPAQTRPWALDHDDLCKAISKLDLGEDATTGESCSDNDNSHGDEDDELDPASPCSDSNPAGIFPAGNRRLP